MQYLEGERLPLCCDQLCEKEQEIRTLRALVEECDFEIRALRAALGDRADDRNHKLDERPTAGRASPTRIHPTESGAKPLAKRAYTKDRLAPQNAAQIKIQMQNVLTEQGPLTVNQIMSAIVADFTFTKSQLQSIVYREVSSPNGIIQRAGRAPLNNEIVIALRLESNAT